MKRETVQRKSYPLFLSKQKKAEALSCGKISPRKPPIEHDSNY